MLELIESPIIPIDQYSKKLKISFCGEIYGYTDVLIKNEKTGDIQRFSDVNKYQEFDEYLNIYYFIISDLLPGKYSIWAATFDDSQISDPIEVSITGDSKQNLIEKAADILRSDKDELKLYNSLAFEIDDSTNIFDYIFKLYLKNDQYKYSYAKLLYCVIDMFNYYQRMSGTLTKPMYIDKETKKFVISSEASKVTRTLLNPNITKTAIRTVVNNEIFDSVFLPTQENSLYLYTSINPSNNVLNTYLFFEPSLDIYNKFKKDIIQKNLLYENAVEKHVNYPSTFISFTDKEKEFASLISTVQPLSPIVRPPEITYDGNYIEVTMLDTELLSAIGKTIYISFIESDLCLKDDSHRIEVTDSSFEFLPGSLFLDHEIFFYWLEDENRKVLSEVRAIDLTENSIDGSIEDFNEKMRQIDFYAYDIHLMPYILNRFGQDYTAISNAVKTSTSNSSTEISNLRDNALIAMCIPINIKTLYRYIQCLTEDKIIYGKYLVDFLKGTVYFKPKENKVVMPLSSNTLYIFEEYSITNGLTVKYQMSSDVAATEHNFYCCDYGLVRCLNIDTYEMSGFLLMDFTHNDLKAHIYKYLIDTVEVV